MLPLTTKATTEALNVSMDRRHPFNTWNDRTRFRQFGFTQQNILIECADLLETRKKYFEEKSLYSLFRNVIPEVVFDFLREIGVFYKIRSVLR